MRYLAAALLVPAFVVGMGGSGTAASTTDPVLGPSDVEVRWGVLGVSRDRRSLVVAATRQTPTCSAVRVDRLEATGSRIRLRVVFEPKEGTEDDTYCQENSIDKPPEVLRLPIGRKVSGQEITGPDKVSSRLLLSYLAPDPDWRGGRRAWPIVGLQVSDARDILRGLGFGASAVSIKGPHAGYVFGLTPALPKFVKKHPPVTLRARQHG